MPGSTAQKYFNDFVGIYYINFRAWVDGGAKWNQLNIPLTQAAYVYENILKNELGNEAAYNYAVKEITDNWIQ